MKLVALSLSAIALLTACNQADPPDRLDDNQVVAAPSADPSPDSSPEEQTANDAAEALRPVADNTPAEPVKTGVRTVDCRVRSGDWVLVDGPCRFTPYKGGSFTLDRGPNEPLKDDILSVTVSIIEPGRAEVRGLTDRGINARWGNANRWSKDPACWVGSDFEVCAR